jgi:NAD(P)-dependent dehydrogenase (short-subunit alcohol dehydrogenase family)
MDLGLAGRRAVVTGGSRGIGKAVARALGREGVVCAICARTAEPLEAAAEELAAAGAEVHPFVADVRDAASVEAFVRGAADRMGGLEIVVNSAARVGGSGVAEDVHGVTDETVLADFEEKLLGTLRTTRAALPHLRRAGWGRIVNVGGLTARTAGSVTAGARNAALVHLTKTLANELGRDGITVNVIHPSTTITDTLEERLSRRAEKEGTTAHELRDRLARGNAIGRLVTAEEVAEVVVFLASAASGAITGESISVGGGAGSAVAY